MTRIKNTLESGIKPVSEHLHPRNRRTAKLLGFAQELRNFVNKIYDGFVHGYYESTMELWDMDARKFQVNSITDPAKKEDCVDAVILKLHEVVCAVECVASVTASSEVHKLAGDARRKMDSLGVSKGPG